MRYRTIDGGSVRLHVAEAGDPGSPPVLLLHGFPEYHGGWADVMARLAGRFHIAAPDQRGYGRSGKPAGDEHYAVNRLAADVAVLAETLWPGRKFLLCGHDWGASVAYAFAFRHPERLSGLVVVNGVHPVCFQRAILVDPEQRKASGYFKALRADGAAVRMAEDDFRRTFAMLERFSHAEWMTPERKEAYRAAWSMPGAMDAMLAWYRATPILVPDLDADVSRPPLLDIDRGLVTVRVPHLVIWGEADEALRSSCLDGLEAFAPDLEILRVAECGHWILHEKPEFVAAQIAAFTDRVFA